MPNGYNYFCCFFTSNGVNVYVVMAFCAGLLNPQEIIGYSQKEGKGIVNHGGGETPLSTWPRGRWESDVL